MPWIAPWPVGWSSEAGEPPHGPGARLLRSLPGRRVWLEDGQVWKGFRAERASLRWRDRWRLRAELRGCERLRAAGIRTPRVVARGARGAWSCLATVEIPEGRSLDALLRHGLTTGSAELAAASKLGAALAHWARTGLEHRDFHPGNWVLDADGEWWLLDGHLVRAAGAAGTRRDLARLVGEWRERAPAAWRRAVWRSFRTHLGATACDFGSPRELVAAARADRAARLERESDRWLRPSEWGRPGAGWTWLRHDLDAAPRGDRWLYREWPRARGRAWLEILGRAFEHGLPVAVPAAWRRDGGRLAVILDSGVPLDPGAARGAPQSEVQWRAAWLDRGYAEPPLPGQTFAVPGGSRRNAGSARGGDPARTPTGAAPRWERRPSFAGSPVSRVWLPVG
jgi:hypothetical protein